MISGDLKKYVTLKFDTKPTDLLVAQNIQLFFPLEERTEVMEKLCEDGWEVKRSGPTTYDETKQLICAFKELKTSFQRKK